VPGAGTTAATPVGFEEDRVDAGAEDAADALDPSGCGLELRGADDVPEGMTVTLGDDVPFAAGLAFDEQPASARITNRIARRFMPLERTLRH
jgi:hypothetical protein